MKFLNRWIERRIAQVLNQPQERDDVEQPVPTPPHPWLRVRPGIIQKHNPVKETSRKIDKRGFDFTIHKANGGFLIEYQRYDQDNDCYHHTLNVVHEDTNLGDAINQIMIYETLRN
jgi:hypothetical protein